MPHLLVKEEKSLLEKLLLLENEKHELLVFAPWLGGDKTERLVALLRQQEELLHDLEQLTEEIEATSSFFSADLEEQQKLRQLAETFGKMHKKNKVLLQKFGDTAQSILKVLEKNCGSKALSIDRQV